MTVGIRIKLEGITQQQFDAVNEHVDPVGDPPEGLLFHSSGPIDGGWGVLDFWESREAFDAFAPRIQSSIGAAGVEMRGAPDVKEFAVHETYKS
jgi:hypothetical protein